MLYQRQSEDFIDTLPKVPVGSCAWSRQAAFVEGRVQESCLYRVDVFARVDLTGRFLQDFIFGPLNRPLPPARLWLLDRLRDAGRL